MWGDTKPPCADNPALFESEQLTDHYEAKKICEGCGIREWCEEQLRVAMADHQHKCGPRGTWAGHYVSVHGIDVMPKRQRAECGTPSGYKRHLRHGEETCAACRQAVLDYRAGIKAAS